MANVALVKKTFTNDSGEIIPYEVLAIIGNLNGEDHTLELKLSKTERILAKALLSSGNMEVTSGKASGDELDEFFKHNSGRSSSNKIDITEE